jgi:hypothetical protein
VDGSGFCTSGAVEPDAAAVVRASATPVEEGSVIAEEIAGSAETAVGEEAVSERDSGMVVVTVDWNDGEEPDVVVAPVVVVVPAPVVFPAELF